MKNNENRSFIFMEITGILGIIALIYILFGLNKNYTTNITINENRRLLPDEIKFINQELIKRNVTDCIIEKTKYGWRCIDKDKKIYKIYKTGRERKRGEKLSLPATNNKTNRGKLFSCC